MSTLEMPNQYNSNAGNFEHINAKRNAFNYVEKENKYLDYEEKKKKTVKKLGGEKPTAFQYFMAFAQCGLCGILAYAEAVNGSQSMVGNGYTENTAIAVGIGLAIIGLTAGHEMAVGLQEKIDEYTGKRIVFTSRFIFGLVLGLAYLGLQIFLILSAGRSAGGMQSATTFYTCYIIFICLLEMLLGSRLPNALNIVAYLFTGIIQRSIFRKMKHFSRLTEEWFQRFLFQVKTSGNSMPDDAENDHIRRARQFYNNGFEISDYSPIN